MGLVTDVVLLVLTAVNSDLHNYVFATGVGCEVTDVGSTELNNVPYISAKVTCAISSSDKKPGCLDQRSGCSNFWEQANNSLKTTTS